MNNRTCFLILLFYLSTFINSHAADNFSFQISAEAGCNQSNTLDNNFVSRLIGRIKYQKYFSKNYVHLKARVSPALYGVKNSAKILKFSGDVIFGQRRKSFNWQACLMNKNYYYSSGMFDDAAFNIVLLGGKITKPFKTKTTFQLGIDYLYRNTLTHPHNRLNSIAGTFCTTYKMGGATYLGLELYFEKFHIGRSHTEEEANANKGWRSGPQISVQHKSSYILNLTYNFFWRYSTLVRQHSQEQRIQLMWGRFLSKNISLFIYLNYHNQPKTNSDIPVELTYMPLNNENWYYLKLGYDLSQITEAYIKMGYVKDELIYRNNSLEGWQGLLGLNFEI